MNMHVPCGHEGRAEVKELMMVSKCIVSAQSNKPVMGIVQDALLSCRKMTTRDIFIDKETMMQIVMKLDAHFIQLPKPAILKPKPLWTGKQLISLAIPKKIIPDIHQFSGWHEESDTPYFSECDTEVLVRDGELLMGTLCKKTIGASSNGLIHKTWLYGGSTVACDLISDIQILANAWLFEHGFSVGVSDCVNYEQIETKRLIDVCINDVKTINANCIQNKINPVNHEQNINTILNKARDSSGCFVQKNLKQNNSLSQMVSGGSKGSIINIAQIMACVGQQNVNGNRITNGYIDRTLPHFKKHDNDPESKGFVKHSYLHGLNPTEFYFHAMGGREGVIDTAIKSVTGDTLIIVIENGMSKYVKIGPWIDSKMAEKATNIRYYPNDRNMEFLELSDKVFIPTGDGKGNTSWGEMTAVTRHDPGEVVYKVTTNSGRYVTVADSESMLVWNGDEFEKKYSHLLRIGDKVPVATTLPKPPIIVDTVDMQQYFPKNKYIYGTDFNKATQLMKDAQGDKFHIPRGWWESNNGTTFVLPYTKKSSLTRVNCKSNTENIVDGCVYPYHASRESCKIPEKFDLNLENGIFIGLFLADGNTDEHSGTVVLSKKDEQVKTFLKSWLEKLNIRYKERVHENKIGTTHSIHAYSTLLQQFIDAFVGRLAHDKRVPDVAYNAPDEFVKGVLIGYFSGDGHVDNNGAITTGTASEKLMDGINLLLTRLGIFGHRGVTQLKSNNLGTKNIKPSYTIAIRAQWASLFARQLTLLQSYKNEKLLQTGKRHTNYIEQNDTVFDTIKTIDAIPVCEKIKLYDVTVPSTYNFAIASMLVVRDTSETGYIQRRLVKAMEDMKIGFDGLLKNSIGDIVQFAYGEDNFDGCKLNTQILPKELSWIKRYTKSNKVHLPVDIGEVFGYVDSLKNLVHQDFIISGDTRTEILNLAGQNHIIKWILEHYLAKYEHLSTSQLQKVRDIIDLQIQKGKVQAGEMVGTVAAQSLGQPITQMTLNTFHSAGISAKNVTLGVPRLKELINIAKSIKCPSMSIKTLPGTNADEFTFENCLLIQIVKKSEIHYKLPVSEIESNYLRLLENDVLSLSIENTNYSILYELDQYIIKSKNITLTFLTHMLNLTCENTWWFVYYVNDKLFAVMRLFSNNGGLDDYDKIRTYASKIENLTISGYKNISKCYKMSDTEFETQGSDLENIFTNPYVNPYETTCNNIIETLQILGIEAARQTLLNEIQMVIEFDGSYVNYRHLSLLIDTITYKGQLMSITRHGMNRTETGVLMRCSFEETVNIIIDSACCAQKDNLSGVTESIVMGQLPKIGTGIVDILMDFDKLNELNNEPDESTLYCPPSPSRKDIQYLDSFFPT